MSLQDYIHISHVGDDFIEDKPLLISKLVTQHKWSKMFYKLNKLYVFEVAHNNLKYFDPIFEKTFAEYRRIFQDDTEIDEVTTKKKSFCLIQNDKRNAYEWHHHHSKSKGDWYNNPPSLLTSSVYYIRLPEGSGGIKFRDPNEEIELMPSEGDLIFFPDNMLHTPAISTCTEYRISFNINIFPKNL